jgi:hypothetical protein
LTVEAGEFLLLPFATQGCGLNCSKKLAGQTLTEAAVAAVSAGLPLFRTKMAAGASGITNDTNDPETKATRQGPALPCFHSLELARRMQAGATKLRLPKDLLG